MARIASDEITLTRLAEPTAVRLYYAKVTSVPPTPPALPSPNPSTTLPSAPWSTTEPTYTGGDTSTVYTTMVTSYGANYHVCGERQLYSAYEAAKAAWNKAQGVKDAFDNLQIGGRNLIENSASVGTGGWAAPGIVATRTDGILIVQAAKGSGNWCSINGMSVRQRLDDIPVGSPVTFSVDIRSADSTTPPYFYFGEGSGWGGYKGLMGTLGTDWSRVSVTNTKTAGATWVPHLGFGGNPGTYEFRNAKLEHGNKATNWTPAPEDIYTIVEFAVGSSNVNPPAAGWSTAKPNKVVGQFIWTRTRSSNGTGPEVVSGPALLTGDKGEQGPQGNQGLQGVQGIQGTQGISFKSLTVYYMLLDRDELAPLTPTKMDPTVDAPGWTMVEPEWAENKNMWRTMRVVTSNDMFTWTPVSKVSTYQAADTAMGEAATARYYANMSLENVTVSATDPSTDEYGHYAGRIWMLVNDADEITNVYISDAGTWKIFSILGGLIVVPGADGRPAFFADQNGVDVSEMVAGAILATEMVAGKFQTLEADITDTLDWKDEFPADSPKILKRVKITADGIVISNDQGDAAKSSMTLTSTELKLRADNTDIISLNAPLRESQTPRQYISESLTLSQYQVQSPNGAPNVLSFIHVGPRS